MAPSTLLPNYDPDTSLVLLTGKVSWGAQVRGRGQMRGDWVKTALADHLTLPYHSLQGDTRVFLYELLPEAPFFLECNSFTSSDPHKVSPETPFTLSSFPRWHYMAPAPSHGHLGKCRGVSGVLSSSQELVVKLNHFWKFNYIRLTYMSLQISYTKNEGKPWNILSNL